MKHVVLKEEPATENMTIKRVVELVWTNAVIRTFKIVLMANVFVKKIKFVAKH